MFNNTYYPAYGNSMQKWGGGGNIQEIKADNCIHDVMMRKIIGRH